MWLDGGCQHCNKGKGKTWDPAVCARNQCEGNVRAIGYQDFGLEPQPPEPPPWIRYLIGCAHSLGRDYAGRILEDEAQKMLQLFPKHQEAVIRRVLGSLERVGAECDREMRLKAEDEKSTRGGKA